MSAVLQFRRAVTRGPTQHPGSLKGTPTHIHLRGVGPFWCCSHVDVCPDSIVHQMAGQLAVLFCSSNKTFSAQLMYCAGGTIAATTLSELYVSTPTGLNCISSHALHVLERCSRRSQQVTPVYAVIQLTRHCAFPRTCAGLRTFSSHRNDSQSDLRGAQAAERSW